MIWISLAPLVAIMIVWLLAPGYIVCRCARLRRVQALGAAAPISAFIISMAAILANRAGLAWGPVPVLILTGILAVVLLLVFAGHDWLRARRLRTPTGTSSADRTAQHDTEPEGSRAPVRRRAGTSGRASSWGACDFPGSSCGPSPSSARRH